MATDYQYTHGPAPELLVTSSPLFSPHTPSTGIRLNNNPISPPPHPQLFLSTHIPQSIQTQLRTIPTQQHPHGLVQFPSSSSSRLDSHSLPYTSTLPLQSTCQSTQKASNSTIKSQYQHHPSQTQSECPPQASLEPFDVALHSNDLILQTTTIYTPILASNTSIIGSHLSRSNISSHPISPNPLSSSHRVQHTTPRYDRTSPHPRSNTHQQHQSLLPSQDQQYQQLPSTPGAPNNNNYTSQAVTTTLPNDRSDRNRDYQPAPALSSASSTTSYYSISSQHTTHSHHPQHHHNRHRQDDRRRGHHHHHQQHHIPQNASIITQHSTTHTPSHLNHIGITHNNNTTINNVSVPPPTPTHQLLAAQSIPGGVHSFGSINITPTTNPLVSLQQTKFLSQQPLQNQSNLSSSSLSSTTSPNSIHQAHIHNTNNNIHNNNHHNNNCNSTNQNHIDPNLSSSQPQITIIQLQPNQLQPHQSTGHQSIQNHHPNHPPHLHPRPLQHQCSSISSISSTTYRDNIHHHNNNNHSTHFSTPPHQHQNGGDSNEGMPLPNTPPSSPTPLGSVTNQHVFQSQIHQFNIPTNNRNINTGMNSDTDANTSTQQQQLQLSRNQNHNNHNHNNNHHNNNTISLTHHNLLPQAQRQDGQSGDSTALCRSRIDYGDDEFILPEPLDLCSYSFSTSTANINQNNNLDYVTATTTAIPIHNNHNHHNNNNNNNNNIGLPTVATSVNGFIPSSSSHHDIDIPPQRRKQHQNTTTLTNQPQNQQQNVLDQNTNNNQDVHTNLTHHHPNNSLTINTPNCQSSTTLKIPNNNINFTSSSARINPNSTNFSATNHMNHTPLPLPNFPASQHQQHQQHQQMAHNFNHTPIIHQDLEDQVDDDEEDDEAMYRSSFAHSHLSLPQHLTQIPSGWEICSGPGVQTPRGTLLTPRTAGNNGNGHTNGQTVGFNHMNNIDLGQVSPFPNQLQTQTNGGTGQNGGNYQIRPTAPGSTSVSNEMSTGGHHGINVNINHNQQQQQHIGGKNHRYTNSTVNSCLKVATTNIHNHHNNGNLNNSTQPVTNTILSSHHNSVNDMGMDNHCDLNRNNNNNNNSYLTSHRLSAPLIHDHSIDQFDGDFLSRPRNDSLQSSSTTNTSASTTSRKLQPLAANESTIPSILELAAEIHSFSLDDSTSKPKLQDMVFNNANFTSQNQYTRSVMGLPSDNNNNNNTTSHMNNNNTTTSLSKLPSGSNDSNTTTSSSVAVSVSVTGGIVVPVYQLQNNNNHSSLSLSQHSQNQQRSKQPPPSLLKHPSQQQQQQQQQLQTTSFFLPSLTPPTQIKTNNHDITTTPLQIHMNTNEHNTFGRNNNPFFTSQLSPRHQQQPHNKQSSGSSNFGDFSQPSQENSFSTPSTTTFNHDAASTSGFLNNNNNNLNFNNTVGIAACSSGSMTRHNACQPIQLHPQSVVQSQVQYSSSSGLKISSVKNNNNMFTVQSSPSANTLNTPNNHNNITHIAPLNFNTNNTANHPNSNSGTTIFSTLSNNNNTNVSVNNNTNRSIVPTPWSSFSISQQE